MARFLKLFAGIALVAATGCNQHNNVLETPVSPTPSIPIASPAPQPPPPLPPPTPPELQPGISTVSIDPRGVNGGDGSTGIVTLASVAQVPGVRVSLSSNDEAVIVPAEVTVPSGSTIAHFAVNTKRFPNDRTAVITASTVNGTATTAYEVWTIEALNYFKFFSDAGDPIGRGGFGRFVPGPSNFLFVCDGSTMRIDVVTPGRESWAATIDAGNAPLEPVGFDMVSPPPEEGLAMLDINQGGRTCTPRDGSVHIWELDLRGGRLNRLYVTFEQRCIINEESRATLQGEIRLENLAPSNSVVNCVTR